jgi:signal transduction histidine kinase
MCPTNPRVKRNEQSNINAVLADITGALVGHFKMTTLLSKVVETSMRTLQAEVCSIFLEDKQNEPGVVTMMAGSGFARKLVGKAKYKIGEGFTGTVANYGSRFNIKSREELENLEVDGKQVWKGKFDKEQWPSEHSEFRNCIAFPLKIKDQVLGVIKVENKDPEYGDHFTEEDDRYFEIIANVVALAIENARLHDARLHEQIERQLKAIAGKAAHRINNQITNYDGIEIELAEQACMAIPDKQKLREITLRMTTTTRNLKRMVREFITYGKPLVIVKEPSNLNKIIQDEIWLARSQAIKIESYLDDSLPVIPVDAGRFAEAIKELLRNSIKAISNNPNYQQLGKIIVTTKLIGEDLSSDPRIPNTPKNVIIEIADSGPGFPANFPICEPFQSTDPQSTGLGLATVKELVEAHGGAITASQSEDGGALIRMTVPLRDQEERE